MSFLARHRRSVLLALACIGAAHAQQDTADRLWQGVEQQSRQRAAPAPLEDEAARALHDPGFAALTRTPEARAQQLLGAILGAVNRRDWFGADRLLRQYAQVPGHDPALTAFVQAGRLAADGDFDAAIDHYRAVQRSNPEFVRAELDLARVLFAENRLRDAGETFGQLRGRRLPPEVEQHIDEYRAAIAQRTRPQVFVSLSAVREDNVNGASTAVDSCALVFLGACLQNTPGEKQADGGVYVEAIAHKLWPLAGHHGLLLRSINYGNRYRDARSYDNLVSTTYLGWQWADARQQWQVLPLFELDDEGGRKIYHAFGLRTGYTRQWSERLQSELNYEYKARRFTAPYAENLEGDFHALTLFGTYVLAPGLSLYGSVALRESAARQRVFFFHDRATRIGVFRNFEGRFTANLAWGWREREALAANALFGRRQQDRENSLYLNLTAPAWAWQGITPSLTYEYRASRSSIPHAYDYLRNRLLLGVNKVF